MTMCSMRMTNLMPCQASHLVPSATEACPAEQLRKNWLHLRWNQIRISCWESTLLARLSRDFSWQIYCRNNAWNPKNWQRWNPHLLHPGATNLPDDFLELSDLAEAIPATALPKYVIYTCTKHKMRLAPVLRRSKVKTSLTNERQSIAALFASTWWSKRNECKHNTKQLN